jgi:hypothetical protein
MSIYAPVFHQEQDLSFGLGCRNERIFSSIITLRNREEE